MSTWHSFDELSESVDERLTATEFGDRSQIYRFDPSIRCPHCDETFETRADRDAHMRESYGTERLPGWMR